MMLPGGKPSKLLEASAALQTAACTHDGSLQVRSMDTSVCAQSKAHAMSMSQMACVDRAMLCTVATSYSHRSGIYACAYVYELYRQVSESAMSCDM